MPDLLAKAYPIVPLFANYKLMTQFLKASGFNPEIVSKIAS
jgi:hypothetical protein